MRIALILLSLLAMIFIGSVTWSLMSQEGWSIKTKSAGQSVDTITIETWKNQIKTEEKISKLSAMVEELAAKQGNLPSKNPSTSGSGSEDIVKVSGKLLSLLMPTMTPSLIENNGIFGLYIFDQSIKYSTYSDTNYGLTIIAMQTGYDVLLKNFKALAGNPYSVNETKNFSFRSFYVNPIKTDTTVRMIVEMESQAIALEIPKNKFTTLKDLLLGKSTLPKKK